MSFVGPTMMMPTMEVPCDNPMEPMEAHEGRVIQNPRSQQAYFQLYQDLVLRAEEEEVVWHFGLLLLILGLVGLNLDR